MKTNMSPKKGPFSKQISLPTPHVNFQEKKSPKLSGWIAIMVLKLPYWIPEAPLSKPSNSLYLNFRKRSSVQVELHCSNEQHMDSLKDVMMVQRSVVEPIPGIPHEDSYQEYA